jgi:hypothetical protein
MELSTDLVVKVIVLLTAIVGLYNTANLEEAKPFLVQLVGVASFLVVPGMMLAFLWFTSTMTNMMHRSKETIAYSGSDAEVMYNMTREFWDQGMRQDGLKLAIEHAFRTKQWRVVVRAAEDLNPTSQKDQVLMRAVKVLGGESALGGQSAPVK